MFLSFLRMQHFQVRLRSKKITHSKTANKILCKNPEKTVVRSLRTTPTRFVWKICKNSKNINVQNFIGLVLFCIDAKFCKKIFVGKLLTKSTRFTCFCTAQTSIFQKKIVNIFSRMNDEFPMFFILCVEFCMFLQKKLLFLNSFR